MANRPHSRGLVHCRATAAAMLAAAVLGAGCTGDPVEQGDQGDAPTPPAPSVTAGSRQAGTPPTDERAPTAAAEHPAVQAALRLDVRTGVPGADGAVVHATLVNDAGEPLVVAPGYGIEQQDADGEFRLFTTGPHVVQDQPEYVGAMQDGWPEQVVPFMNEEGAWAFLPPGTYRFTVNVDRPDGNAPRPVRTVARVP